MKGNLILTLTDLAFSTFAAREGMTGAAVIYKLTCVEQVKHQAGQEFTYLDWQLTDVSVRWYKEINGVPNAKMFQDFITTKEKKFNGKIEKFFENATTYFSKVTEQKLYEYRNILEYVDGGYVITNKISDKNLEDMRANMDESDVEGFDEFVEKHWGKQIKKTKRTKVEEQ